MGCAAEAAAMGQVAILLGARAEIECLADIGAISFDPDLAKPVLLSGRLAESDSVVVIVVVAAHGTGRTGAAS